ncbi:FAD-binding protein [Sulfolobus sp. S-194]|uniref:4Fe-4S dicluster domain-containing protein n=1 Tax=Sulfolobus sp. S-194 TaxID=2512240 RepID=UPI001436E3DA|nr:4Fe-4S dicluster domain-containing protein [Sulfolobus sp. S-194]QIW23392.1 FAD-binding protein [Sulfolobus sp. S-194]
MRVTDASIFSRALTTIEIKEIEKFLIKEEKEVVIGRLTSMNGDLIKYSNPKIIPSPTKLPSGNIIEEIKFDSSIYSVYRVAPGLTFEELITELKKYSKVPVLFPLYLQGSVGGFIATNGSGFGSYKFGFVRGEKEVHSLKDNEAIVMTANYTEVIESDKESKFAWSAIILDNKERFYLTSNYAKLEGISGSSIDTYSLINDINKIVIQSFKRDYIPLMLRFPEYSYSKLAQLNFFEKIIGYKINFNSPDKYYVFLGRIKFDDLNELFSFLKKNREFLPFPSLSEYDKLHLEILNKVGKKIKLPKEYKSIIGIYNEAIKCINCGLCLNVCKAYEITHNPLYSPVGKISRLIMEEKNFETCFGCVKDEEVCPINIPISKLTTEGVNIISPEKIKIEIQDLPSDISSLANKLQNTYRNRPLYLLFVGCASKYDINGVRGFLTYLLDKGNSLPQEFSPRVELVNNCCGFDDFIGGNIQGAKDKVGKILELKKNKNAQGIYFLCPEALYVYNLLSGDKGILAYEVVKGDLKERKIHSGCWAKKLGIKGNDDECAGLNFTTYKGYPLPSKGKAVLTICPFSTWKYGTSSVYSVFYVGSENMEKLVGEKDLDNLLLNLSIDSIKGALIESVDEIAEKVSLWNLGGEGYFILVTYPVILNKFKNILEQKIKEHERKEEIIKYISKIVNDTIILDQKITLISDYLKGQNYSSLIMEMREKILTSSKLEYSAKDLVNSDQMIKAIEEIIKRAITPKLIERVFKEIIYS